MPGAISTRTKIQRVSRMSAARTCVEGVRDQNVYQGVRSLIEVSHRQGFTTCGAHTVSCLYGFDAVS